MASSREQSDVELVALKMDFEKPDGATRQETGGSVKDSDLDVSTFDKHTSIKSNVVRSGSGGRGRLSSGGVIRKSSKRGSKGAPTYGLHDEVKYDRGLEYLEWCNASIVNVHEPTEFENERTYDILLKGKDGEEGEFIEGVKADQLMAKGRRERNVSHIRFDARGSVKMSRKKARSVLCARLYSQPFLFLLTHGVAF